MKVCIFTADSNGGYPVPAVKDGAVPILIEHLVEQNSINKLCDLVIVSFYDKEAELKAEEYKNVEFKWIKVPKIIKLFDFIFFNCIKICFRNKKIISYKSIFSLLFYINKSSKILKEEKFDKVVLENNIPLSKIIKKSNYNGEFFYHLHNIPRINYNCKDVFEKCNGYLCVSDYVGKQIMLETNPIGPIKKERVHTLYNCIDTNKFCVKQYSDFSFKIRSKYNISYDEKILIFVGRLSEEKGIDKILEAISKLKNKKFKLLIVGSLMHNLNTKDLYHEKLIKLINSDIKDKVIFTGYIDHEELPKYYNISDIAIMPSMWEEPAGLTMIEALCCGASLITTNSGGIPEYVGKYAIIVEKDENVVDNIANSIDKLLSQEKIIDYDKLSEMYSFFSTNNYMKNFVEIIKNDND